MGLNQELENAATGFAIIHASPKFSQLPVVISEADPEGCGACSPPEHPEDEYRNGTLYPTYTAAAMKGLTDLARREHVHLIGFLTWAFEFEDQPYFSSHRALSTNGVDKPELNFFRMAGLLGGERVAATSSGSVPVRTIVTSGVRQQPDIDTIATRESNSAAVMVWNYQADAVPGPGAPVQISVSGIPKSVHRVLVQQFRIDEHHSNAFTVWKAMDSPQHPTAEQYAKLQAAGQLQLKGSPRWATANRGVVNVQLELPRESVALLRVSWEPTGD
jgi:xylan 1,4-beta-xylosidase